MTSLCRNNLEPTDGSGKVSFPDFVRYIISMEEEERIVLDPHWQSVHKVITYNKVQVNYATK